MLLNEKEGKYTHVLCGTIIHPGKNLVDVIKQF